jgi:hypothetical protein
MPTNYKILGQQSPTGTTNVDLYTVPSSTATVISSLVVSNVTASPASFRIFIRNNGAAASATNTLAQDVVIAGNSIFSATQGLTIDAADVITVRSSVANALTFQVFGSEIS